MPLDGTWEFQLRSDDTALEAAEWKQVEVPGLWTMWSAEDRPYYTNIPMPFDEVYPTVPERNPVGVYRRIVDLTRRSERTILHVGAVEGYLHVTVNGVPVGTSGDSHLAAEFDLTDLIIDGPNELELTVAKWSSASYLEDQDQWWHSGISRSVYLYTVPEIRLADVRVEADYDSATGRGSLRVVASTFGLKHQSAVEHSVRVRTHGVDLAAPIAPNAATPMMPPPSRDRTVQPQQKYPEDFMDQVSITATDVGEEFDHAHGGQFMPQPQPAGTAEIESHDLEVMPWSAECPRLHDLTVDLIDGDGRTVDSTAFRIGYRRVRVVGRDLLVNGQPILIQGVNRHDIDPHAGRVMTRERILAELSLLKRFNVNAIRTSHYPNDPLFLDLCDEIGFYVVDEADVEGHAFLGTIANEPSYLPEIVERVSRMVLRDRNHPCVIVWSLGNESGYGAAHDAAAAWVRRFESTRPVQYEGAVAGNWHGGHRATDIVCPMYPSFASVAGYAAHSRADRPLIFCEYAYSQGNSTGGFDEYWKLFESLPGVQGGFIWEFLDHTLDPDQSGRMLYGGDFGDDAPNGITVLNGVVSSDLIPRPAFYEIRSVFSPVAIVSDSESAMRGQLRLRNRQFFADFSAYVFEVRVETDSGPMHSTRLEVAEVEPRGEVSVALPAEIVDALHEANALAVTVTVRTAATALWADADTEIAVHQVKLNRAGRALPAGLYAPDVDIAGDVRHPLIKAAPRLSLWRALTDNEMSFALDQRFVRSGFFRLDHDGDPSVTKNSEDVNVNIRYRTAYGEEVTHWRTISEVAPGDFIFNERISLPKGTRDGLRVGVEFELAGEFIDAAWTGLGPWENYPDRRSGALLGRWQSTIDDLVVPYVRPQENGTRGDVTDLQLSGSSGRVQVSASVPLHMNVARHSIDQLEQTGHWWELPQSAATIVHIDIAQRGMGTGRLGPDTRPRFRLAGDSYSWSWRLTLGSGG